MPALDTTVATLADLIGFASISSESNLELAGYLSNRLADAGARVEMVHNETFTKASVFASLGPEDGGGILLSGHTDVVPVEGQDWSADPFALGVAGGRLYGRGTCDMKGFIAAALGLAADLKDRALRRPLHFAFTYDEEIGCFGARALVDHLKGREALPALAIIGEPTGMQIIEGHKGCYEYTTRFTGLEGHGSAPDRGVNAVEFAVRYAARMLALHDELRAAAPAEGRFVPPWTTLNIGRLSGGVAHNVIANLAQIDWEMRPVRAADADYVKAALADFATGTLLPAMRSVDPSAGIETEVIGEVAGLVPMPANEARDLVAELTGGHDTGLVPFGTEAGLFQALGLSVVVCGPGHIAQAHKADEYLALDQLQACLDMLAGLDRKLTADG
jgi:acetylornithine deacetylase